MILTDAQRAALTEAVRDVARTEILPRFRRLAPDEIDAKSRPDDLVTVADRAAEAALEERVADILPDAAFVGEEGVEGDPSRLDVLATDELAVVVDPVDGTWNFARGLAVFGVMLAVQVRGETVFGLVHDPVLDDWVVAIKGLGAQFVRPGAAPVPLRVCPPRGEAEETGYLPFGLFSTTHKTALAALQPRFSRIQSLRCSAHEYRMMAQGHVDWIVSAQSKPWDHLAGRLILREAGGATGVAGGGRYHPDRGDQVLLAATSVEGLARLDRTISAALTD